MTTGQRIAAKRKELELSQEGLGEALGVSRQSIYKWESDASLPDIDKLVALSRLFGVPVGWLLGVEGDPGPEASAPNGPDELTEAQLKMVEEILARYQQAQPKPKKHRRWPLVLAGLALCLVLFNLFERLDQLGNQYNNLANSVGSITSNVNHQISTITDRVEEVLKSQNELTADYSTQLLAADLARNTVTFSARAVPKTYVEGMQAVFLADSGDGPAEFPAQEGPGRTYTAQLSCEITDSITLSVVFIHGETRQTQLLDTYQGLYGSSMPYVDFRQLEGAFLHVEADEDGVFRTEACSGVLVCPTASAPEETKLGLVYMDSVRVGLFRNWELVRWLELGIQSEEQDGSGQGSPGSIDVSDLGPEQKLRCSLPAMELELERGDTLVFAAVYTDQYGRQGVAPSVPWFIVEGNEIIWEGGDGTPYYDLSNYTFE